VKKDYDIKKMHSLRKLCRRARYWSEFLAPVPGRPAAMFARRFKALADVLGDLHDADMAILRVRQQDPPVGPQLLRVLLADKRRLLAAFGRTWRSLRSPSMLFAAAALFEQAKNNTVFLYLVRHATAGAKGGSERRLLDSQGILEAQTAGRALSLMQCRPLAIASSPLARSLDTAAILAQSFSFTAPVKRKQCLLPSADITDTLTWLTTVHAPSCVCVGHMPHLAQLSKALLKPGSGRPIEFKKASACCISFAGGIEQGKGSLEWYFTPRKMTRIVSRITGRG
jgi:phosphohistidine phosphatase SixA